MLANIAWWGAGLIGAGIIFFGARFLVQPRAAAGGFGIPGEPPAAANGFAGWLTVKAVRDIASGLFIFILMANGAPHLLGCSCWRRPPSPSGTRRSSLGAVDRRRRPISSTARPRW